MRKRNCNETAASIVAREKFAIEVFRFEFFCYFCCRIRTIETNRDEVNMVNMIRDFKRKITSTDGSRRPLNKVNSDWLMLEQPNDRKSKERNM